MARQCPAGRLAFDEAAWFLGGRHHHLSPSVLGGHWRLLRPWLVGASPASPALFARVCSCWQIYAVRANPREDLCLKRFIVAAPRRRADGGRGPRQGAWHTRCLLYGCRLQISQLPCKFIALKKCEFSTTLFAAPCLPSTFFLPPLPFNFLLLLFLRVLLIPFCLAAAA